jgi:hypothetical protein
MAWDEQKYDEFAKRMEETYPEMFGGQYGGFSIGPGWWPIVESLCADIQHHLNWKNRESQVVPPVVVEQIKEKFGGLRFYYQGGDDTITGMVRMAESWASHSCEECGAPGVRRSGGWIRTLCDHHEEQRQAAMKERFNHE